MTLVLFWQFTRRKQIVHNLSEIDIDTGPYLITEIQIHTKDIICSKGFHFVLFLIGIIRRIDADKPIGICPFRIFVQNRIQDIPVYYFGFVSFDQIDHIVAA